MRSDKLILRTTILILLTITNIELHGQQEINQDWNAFAQSFDMASYQGGQFRFKGFVRTEGLVTGSHAQLWARVDVAEGTGFFDNMNQRPIINNEWKEYLIEGAVDRKATRLTIGGMGQGTGKYYFDNFTLEMKSKDGDWTKLQVTNSGFEYSSFKNDWKSYNVKGFMLNLTTENVFSGDYSLFLSANLDGR